MTLAIWHGGQSGVDRGAHLAAVELQASIGGWMPKSADDEYGPISPDVARHLKACRKPGYAPRTRENIEGAHALLVIVANAHVPYATPGTKLTLEERRIAKPAMPWRVVDPSHSPAAVAAWAAELDAARTAKGLRETRLLVAGPRASLWPEGEREARRFVRAILSGVGQ